MFSTDAPHFVWRILLTYSEYESISDTDRIQRMIAAGNNRMRPIAMTTIAAIFALLPLAIGMGAGSEMLKPLAIALVSGLIVQIPLVLIVLPVLLLILHSKRKLVDLQPRLV